MLRVGLTGGIGSGKSTVARLFADRGVPVIDTDEIARRLVTPGQESYRDIVHAFGKEIVATNEELDRAELRKRVFESDAARAQLEAILHPRIRAAVQAEFALINAAYCLVVIPLLVERSWPAQDVDRILVVDATPETQIARVQARSGLAIAQIRKIMAAQASREQRLRAAHDVILNEGSVSDLEAEVTRLDRLYRGLAVAHAPAH